MLYQVNTRVLLTEIGQHIGRTATFDDVSDEVLDRWQSFGFHWIWLLSVWQTGDTSRSISRSSSEWRREFESTLPDLTEDDIQGSGFAIVDYRVSHAMGGAASLARLRDRMRSRGLKLMLDFVPNHMGLDHDWIIRQPDYFIRGTEERLAREPQNYFRHGNGQIFAHGRDPYFAGWSDTIQLDYSNPDLIRNMTEELARISSLCDGIRCDMAMLILPDVFQRTWNRPALPFWSAAISTVKELNPEFCFMAEVYWDREWDLQQLGFDYCYDKRLYDRLLHENARSVHMHLVAGLDYQSKLTRFLENHDEPRTNHVLPRDKHFAAAIVTYLTPGLPFFHEGQFEGRKIKVSPHLVRRPAEDPIEEIAAFYQRLLRIVRDPILRSGRWLLLDAKPAWEGNQTHENLVCFRWKDIDNRQWVIVVNYSDRSSQGRVRFTIDRTCISQVRFRDGMSEMLYEHHRGELFSPGLPVDLAPWGFLVLEEVDD